MRFAASWGIVFLFTFAVYALTHDLPWYHYGVESAYWMRGWMADWKGQVGRFTVEQTFVIGGTALVFLWSGLTIWRAK